MHPKDWEELDFSKTIIKNDVGKRNQIKTSEIKEEGLCPVIDQGQNYIAGYSNEKDKVYYPKKPLIIFGDHTRCFKYVDFPFIIGADGTKVLSPNTKIYDSKFYYYALSGLDIPSKGYNRHFKLLKEKQVVCPPLPEQRNIAFILSKIQSAIETQEKIIKTTTELKKALMQKLFAEGLHNEPQKETELGLVPESWEVKQLKDIALIERGKFTHRPRNDPRYYGGDVPFIQTGDITSLNGRVTNYSQTLNKLGLSVSRIFPKGTIVITIAANIGDTAILEFDCAFPDSIIGITPCPQVLVTYLEYYLRTQKESMDRIAPRGTQKNINIQFLVPWLIPIPPLKEQKVISDILQCVDDKIKNAHNKELLYKSLFKSMLCQLMTGQTRVKGMSFN